MANNTCQREIGQREWRSETFDEIDEKWKETFQFLTFGYHNERHGETWREHAESYTIGVEQSASKQTVLNLRLMSPWVRGSKKWKILLYLPLFSSSINISQLKTKIGQLVGRCVFSAIFRSCARYTSWWMDKLLMEEVKATLIGDVSAWYEPPGIFTSHNHVRKFGGCPPQAEDESGNLHISNLKFNIFHLTHHQVWSKANQSYARWLGKVRKNISDNFQL